MGYVSVRKMLSEVSALELSRWQAYSRYRAEKSEEDGDGGAAEARKKKQAEQRRGRAEAAEERGELPSGGGEVSRSPSEPAPDVSPEGVEFPPASLWEQPTK